MLVLAGTTEPTILPVSRIMIETHVALLASVRRGRRETRLAPRLPFAFTPFSFSSLVISGRRGGGRRADEASEASGCVCYNRLQTRPWG